MNPELFFYKASSYEYALSIFLDRFGGQVGSVTNNSGTLYCVKNLEGYYRVIGLEIPEEAKCDGLPTISLPIMWEFRRVE